MAVLKKKTKLKILKKLTLLSLLFLLVSGWFEFRFSTIQSRFLSKYSADLIATVENGPSNAIIFPRSGPLNNHRGYTRIPEIDERLRGRGFFIEEQARFSPQLISLTSFDIPAPYREPDVVGLTIHDNSGDIIYDATTNLRSYKRFIDIPPLIVKSLLYIEDRQLIQPLDVHNNPVINWKRLSRASVLYAANKFGMNFPREGGSTLATQLEKFRYSPYGRTDSVATKFTQIASASLKVYQTGMDTTLARQNIVLDYLNSVPFAAAPGYGEVYGLPQGLYQWFGMDIDDVSKDLNSTDTNRRKVSTFKKVLTLLCAIRAPSYYLMNNQTALEHRVLLYISLLEKEDIIAPAFAEQLRQMKIELMPQKAEMMPIAKPLKRAINTIRLDLMQALQIPSFYELNRLALEVDTSIDARLQSDIMNVLSKLKNKEFISQQGLRAKRLLARGDPGQLIYSFLLYEMTPLGNELRVHADTNDQYYDINRDTKLDLGSTAKLRTLVHYLEVMYELYQEFLPAAANKSFDWQSKPQDPLTIWAMRTIRRHKNISIEDFLNQAISRKYSASPYETFFTGGGIHHFGNFDPRDNKRRISVRNATVRSVNLVYIRLMRDLVRYHKARLPYDAKKVRHNVSHPLRRIFLEASADAEARIYLKRFYRKYVGLTPTAILAKLLKSYKYRDRALTIIFYTWNIGMSSGDLAKWLEDNNENVSKEHLEKLIRTYNKSYFDLSDYAYLLNKHPLELWVSGELYNDFTVNWGQLLATSEFVRRSSSEWLFKTRNRAAQNRRLAIKIEKDAFNSIAKYWKKVGYPFSSLVPSFATAIGTSADKPEALAELMGIIANNGFRRPGILVKTLKMAENTPYHTVFQRTQEKGEQVIPAPVAKVIRETLQKTVERGTARRIFGAFKIGEELPVVVGGKTGSGDNRIKTFRRGGELMSSTAINRTATFVFFIGDRYYGVITAHVSGPESGDYGFTSSLPVAVLKLLAPSINELLLQRTLSEGTRQMINTS
jgi:membrane peptidoglycan carboxypeptidase